ncbi:MAG: type I restriction endonuclease subunit R [Gemmatimonadetes bacterium]|nr:type I restriction endonuclease subunit R [Gemmatimonadota bacterium]
MPRRWGTESEFEETTIERLKLLGYTHQRGAELDRAPDEVVLRDVLRANLRKRYFDLPDASVDEAVALISRPEGVDTLRRNLAFHHALVHGLDVPVELPDGSRTHRHVLPIAWEDPDANDFRVINQLPVHGRNDRRPDLVVYVNGLPFVVFELKNPYSEKPTVEEAYNQVQHYALDIPQLFDYNALVVISDGVSTLHGMWTAGPEWFAPWKSVDGFAVEPGTTGSMKALVQGLFPRDRLLQYVRDFIGFEVANDQVNKKGAKYHQFFAVRLAAEKAVQSMAPGADRRIGVVWHTTGSGKSLSMAFLVAMLRRHSALQNPTFVIQVDRTDLDDQLHDQFVALRSLVGEVKHAETAEEMRDLLRGEGGEVVFTTLEKFRLNSSVGEMTHPILSERSNIVIIADEAHRSQYGYTDGYARRLADALPHARRIGFTGTPISLAGADTVAVFGDLIHTYDIKQAQEDRATVPIFYAPRQVRLHLGRGDVNEALADLTEGEQPELVERGLPRWARLAQLTGTRERVDQLARDLLDHFRDRSATLEGKALVVCMTRDNCVRLYDALTRLPNCPEVRIVMTGNPATDPVEWNQAGHITTKAQRDGIKERMRNPADPLRMAIVCDMWLTGTDIPCLHTLYVDKPMRGHTMIQAISRVNRVFRDKPHGLIVDYIGIGDELREATERYTDGGGGGAPAPDVEDEGRRIFEASLANVRSVLPRGRDYGGWRRLSNIELEDLYALVYGTLAEDEELKTDFLAAEQRLTAAFLLVKHLDDCRAHADEVVFYQRVRKQIEKTLPGQKPGQHLERAIRDLVDDAVESEGVIDIFQVAGIERPDVSIIDDEFLQTFRDRPHPDLRVRLLERLMRDELQRRQGRNLARAKSFRERLEATLQKYHSRLIDAAAVVQTMLDIRREIEEDTRRAQMLGLGQDELAFYDTIAENHEAVYDQQFLRDLVHDVVQTIKANLQIDWTEPHREDVKAAVRTAVKRVLRRRKVNAADLDPFLNRIVQQAEALYGDWPLAA